MTNTFEKYHTYARKFSNCWSDKFSTEKYELSLLRVELKLSEEGWYLNDTHILVCLLQKKSLKKPFPLYLFLAYDYVYLIGYKYLRIYSNSYAPECK